MSINAFRAGLATAGLSLLWASAAQASAPVISDLPDVTISDKEDNYGGTNNNYFVFTNAFSFDNYVSDADTATSSLLWGFDEGTDSAANSTTRYFSVNNKQSIAIGDAAIAAAQTSPTTRLNIAGANELRSASSFASFRDIVFSPGTGGLTSAFPSPTAPALHTHAAGKVVRFYVSDGTNVSSNDIIVRAVDNETTASDDGVSGGFSYLKVDAFTTSTGWSETGQSASFLTTNNLGSRSFDAGNSALLSTVNTGNFTRVFGWIENEATDVPYTSFGPGKFARAKFSIYYTGAGDSGSSTLANLVPNFRLSVRQKGVVTMFQDVLHNSGTGDPGNKDRAREFGPSKNSSAPSVYRVDYDPVDVPYVANSTTEGLTRAIEILADLPDYQYVSGTVALTDSSIGAYPAISSGVTPVKTYVSGGTAGSADFDNANIQLVNVGFSRAEVLNFLLNPTGSLTITANEAGLTVAKATSGITVNSTGVATDRVGLAVVDFLAGNFADIASNASRVRVEAGKTYLATFRLSHAGASNTSPLVRLRVRSIKFAYAARLELAGAKTLGSAEGQTFISQVAPGTGSQVTNDVNGYYYNVLYNTPLDGDIRADVAGTIATKFPTISALPGPGSSTASDRDLKIGFDVIDSLSFATGNEVEAANNLRLNQVEIRSVDRIQD